MTPYSPLKVRPRFGGICSSPEAMNGPSKKQELPAPCWFLAWTFSQNMKATCSSETSADFQRYTLHSPEEGTLQKFPCENLKYFFRIYANSSRKHQKFSLLFFLRLFERYTYPFPPSFVYHCVLLGV
jgi:hypothetical protein